MTMFIILAVLLFSASYPWTDPGVLGSFRLESSRSSRKWTAPVVALHTK